MSLTTRPPALPSVQTTPMTYQDYLRKYMEQFGVSSQPYDVAAPQVAPQSPMQVNPAEIAKNIVKGQIMREGVSQASNLASSEAANQAWNSGADQAWQAQQQAWNSGADAATQATDGATTAGSSWTSAPATGSIGQIAGALAAAKGGYDTLKGYQHGGEGMRSGLTTMGAGIGTMLGGPLGAAGGAVVGNVAGYGLQGNSWKNDLALAALGPMGWTALAAKKFGLLKPHKTTRQVAQEHTQDLMKTGVDNKPWQDYVSGMRAQFNAPPPDKSKPFAGKYGSWDEYKKAGLEAADLTGVYGNLKTFGPEWAGIDQAKRQSITQALINADLYNSKKGEVEITNADKAKEIFKSMIAQGSAVPSAIPMGVPRITIPRSSTVSPGIRKDGTRIDYSKKKK